jgi:hypothetical protein
MKTPLQRRALEIVRSEMRLYDALSRPAKLRYEPAVSHYLDELAQDKLAHHEHGTRSCAHGRALHDVCTECQRNDEDCKAYRVAAMQRIKDLLALLGE